MTSDGDLQATSPQLRETAPGDPLICHECGLLHRTRPLSVGEVASCGRCGCRLYARGAGGLDAPIALNLAGVLFFVLANAFPFMDFRLQGREQVNHLISGVAELFLADLWFLAVVVLLFGIAIPGLKLGASLYVLVPLHFGRRAPGSARVFRFAEILRPWAMMEVYLLGVIVAYVKLVDMATIGLGPGVFSFVLLIVAMTAAEYVLEPREVWEALAPARGFRPAASADAEPGPLAGCHSCDLAVPLPAGHHHARCPRCGSALHLRKPDSLARSWALVLTGFFLYIPANVYPVMTVISFGSGAPDTIISGVIHLAEAGMWPLALLVFFASVTVPMLKLIGMVYLLVSVQRGSNWRPRDRTKLYRVVEAVGRWSMIDIFMIAILVALVKLGSIATIEPGVGATSFAAVVIVTMIAAMSFDPRLIWDRAGASDD